MLSANLDGDVPLKDVARECRLSVSHFSRAFRRTVGVAPHSWLVTRRIEVTKEECLILTSNQGHACRLSLRTC